jgi:hypothetical protein
MEKDNNREHSDKGSNVTVLLVDLREFHVIVQVTQHS